ncbi:MAG: glycosyltransferase [Planctomycetota bacterium]
MLLLYVADLSPGGTAAMRMRVLRDLGLEVIPFDTARPAPAGSRPCARLLRRLEFHCSLGRLNRDLRDFAAAASPNVVWVDKGLCVRKDTLAAIRDATHALLVHYNPDDPFADRSLRRRLLWRTFVSAIPLYDLHFVPRVENVADYAQRRARKVVRFHRGYHPALHRRLPPGPWCAPPYLSDVCFPGAFEPQRRNDLLFLLRSGAPLTIWGRTWRTSRRLAPFSDHFIPRTPLGEEYVQVINGAGICLNFLRRANRDRENSRTFEIPACGTFLLGERNDEQLALFEEGKEAEFFSSREELLDKARFYLAHDDARRRLADAGCARCLSSPYSYRDRLKAMLAEVHALR